MKAKLATLVAVIAFCFCLAPGFALAADDPDSTTLQADPAADLAQDGPDFSSFTSKYALLKSNGWLYRCDKDGVAAETVTIDGKNYNATYWASSAELAKVTKVFVASNVVGLADYSATKEGLDLTHPRIKYFQDGAWKSDRACFAGAPTVEASQVLVKLSALTFLRNDSDVNKCSVIADGLFAGSGIKKVSSLNKTKIKQVGPKTFYNCAALTKIALPATCTTVGANAFKGCTALTAASLGSGVEMVGARAFEGCTALAEAKLPKACTSVGKRAFAGCSALASVSTGSGKTKVGTEAFAECSALTTAMLGTLSSIGKNAFAGCTSLKTVSIDECTTIDTTSFAGLGNLATVTIGSCKTIGASAFANLPSLVTVSVGSSKTIGASAFANLPKLTTASIGTSGAIDASVFKGSRALKSLSLSECASIGASAFAGFPNLSTVSIGSCKSVGASAFANCKKLSSATLSGAKAVSSNAFSNCTALASANLASCSSVGKQAFSNCTALKWVSAPACTTVGISAFVNCRSLASANLASCATVGKQAFSNCKALSSVALGKCKTIGASAFANCKALKSVSLPAVVTVSKQAFAGCSALKTINLGTKVKKFGTRAFEGTRIAKLELSAKTKSLPASLMGAKGASSVPLKTLILRASRKVSIPNTSTFARSSLAKAAAKAGKIYVPAAQYKKYVSKKKSNKWRKYRNKFRSMPDFTKAKVKVSNATFTGKGLSPAVRVKFGKKTLKAGVDYTVSYSNNKSVGTGTATVTGKGIYFGKKKATFKIKKAANTLKVSNVTRYVTDTTVKKKGAVIYGATGIEGAQGTLTFKKLSGSGALSVNSSTGAVSVKKGTSAGTYKMRLSVRAAGNDSYKAKTKKMTLTVKVTSKEEVLKHHSASTFISIAQAEYQKWKAGKTPKDKYWHAFSNREQSWCSEFVGWCLREAGLVQGVTMPNNVTCAKPYYSFYSKHPELATIHKNDGTYCPQPGDIVLQIHNGDTLWFWHTEMVTWSDGYNYGGYSGGWRVGATSRSLGSSSYYWFITIKWDAV